MAGIQNFRSDPMLYCILARILKYCMIDLVWIYNFFISFFGHVNRLLYFPESLRLRIFGIRYLKWYVMRVLVIFQHWGYICSNLWSRQFFRIRLARKSRNWKNFLHNFSRYSTNGWKMERVLFFLGVAFMLREKKSREPGARRYGTLRASGHLWIFVYRLWLKRKISSVKSIGVDFRFSKTALLGLGH